MHKRIHKVVSLVTAALLFVTSTFAYVNTAYAAETVKTDDAYETTYAIAELGTPGGYGFSAKETENGLSFTFSGRYQEVQYAIPEDVVKAGLKGYRVNVSKTDYLGLKIYSDEGEKVAVYWVDNVALEDDSVVPTKIGFMNTLDGENSYEFTSVTFITANEVSVEAPAEPKTPDEQTEAKEYVYTYTPADVNLRYRWSDASAADGELEFPSQYYEYLGTFPTAFYFDNIESITVNVASQENGFCVKLYNDADGKNDDNVCFTEWGLNEKNSYTITPSASGRLYHFGIMSHAEKEDAEGNAVYPYKAAITSIVVKLKGEHVEKEEPSNPTQPATASTVTLDKDALKFKNRWVNEYSESNTLKFTGQYQEFVLDLGETVPAEEMEYVKVMVADQGNNFCIKLYDTGMNEMQHGYENNGASSYEYAPNYDGDVRYLGFMSMPSGEENYPYNVTITGVEYKRVSAAPIVSEETDTYDSEKLVFEERWDHIPVEGNTITFTKDWDEYWFALSKPVVGDKIKSLKVTVKDQTAVVAFKLYDAEGTELKAFYNDNIPGNVYDIAYETSKEITNIAVMAMGSKGNEYPSTITIENVEIVIDTSPETVEKGVEYDIVNLRDEMCKVLGEDFIVGTALSYDEFADENDIALALKHFNGVTLGNELKPDAMLKNGAKITTVELNGEEIAFPVLDFNTPESRLDLFVDWNNDHPDKKIRVRGHVLVWHSQTPDFFFREDYDTSKGYVTPEVMNKRLEAYIRAVCEHFTSEDSKYKDLFYGWDVVNEAVSDGSGTYRNASENSTWWRVYQSSEFINNAFVYANKYMPADIALFYNDYNAYQPGKAAGILTLIENVKATPGSRIDGMGMQAHYFTADNNPTMEAVKKAAKAYGEVVDQVQFTEIDFKGSTGPKDEQLAKRYKDLYDTVRRLIDEGTNVTGFTVWGVVDKHSWLQTANSAGGGASGNSKQYPLLFDNNYKAKPAFYALCNAGELEPEIKNVSMVQRIGNLWLSEEYSLKGDVATFKTVWYEEDVEVLVKVKDDTVDENDSFTVYVYNGEEISSYVMNRADCGETEEGYAAIIVSPAGKEAIINNKIKLDVVVTDGENKYAFCDTTFSQETSDKYYAVVTTKPMLDVYKGSVDIDGVADEAAWANVESFPLTINLGADVTATAKLLWDEEYLYVLMDVADSVLNKDASQAHEQDSVEIFIDENNEKSASYQADDKQYRINYNNERSFNGTKCLDENMLSAVVLTEEGYMVEAAFKWTDIEAQTFSTIGLELQVNDANANGTRSGTLSWADKTGNGWSSPEVFGTIILLDEKSEEPANPTPETPTPVTPAPTPAPSTDSGSTGSSGGSSSSTPAQSTPAADTQANAQAAAPVNETPGRVTPSQRNTENATAETQEPTAEVSEEKEETPAAPEPAAEEVTEEVKEIEESETALAAAPEAEVAAVAAADNKTLPVAATVVLALAVIGAGGAVWFLKLRHLVK